MYNHLIAASDWPHSFFAPKEFLFSISVLFVTADAWVETSHVETFSRSIITANYVSIYIETIYKLIKF